MAKKPVFLDDIKWGNIELEGFSDEQLFDPNLNRRLANRLKAQDPEYRKNHAEAIAQLKQDPEWRKNHAEAIAQRTQDPEWRKKNAESNRRKAQDPKWQKNHAEAIAQRTQDPEWRKKNAESNRRQAQDPKWQAAHKAGIRLHHRRSIVTPEGQFDSRAEAVDYYLDNKILPTRKTRESVRKFLDTQTKKEGSGFYYEDTR